MLRPNKLTTARNENCNLQLVSSSSDISSHHQCCSDKHTDSSICSDSSDSGHTSVYRQAPTQIPTTTYQTYQYKNLTTLQEDAAIESCSLMGKETSI